MKTKINRFLVSALTALLLFSMIIASTVPAFATSESCVISNLDELVAFRDAVNNGNTYEGVTVTLAADISMSDIAWTPVGNGTRSGNTYSGAAFKGTFDGNNHTLSGLNVSSENAGLFGVVDGGTVKNLNLTNVNVSGVDCAGAAVGLMVNNALADNITVAGTVTSGDGAGGVVGRMTIEGAITRCTNHATISATDSGSAAGGIVGKAYYTNTDKEMLISDCVNNGTVSAPYAAGGIVALSAANVLDNSNFANVTGGAEAGGIVAEQTNYGTIARNSNSGTVSNNGTGGTTYGGIIGWIRYQNNASYTSNEVITVSSNRNSGNINASGASLGAGGIVGSVYNAATITGNINTATSVSGGTFAAGIAGNLQTNSANLYHDATSISVTYNASSTALDAISATGICKDLYAYKNDPTFTVENNTANCAALVTDANGNTLCYETLDAALSAAEDGAVVTLMGDVESSSIVTLDKAVTFNGNGFTLRSTAGRAINVDCADKVSILNLTIDGKGICQRGVNIINQAGTVNLNNVVASNFTHYSVHVATSAGAVQLNIAECQLSSYGALAIYGTGTVATITDSELNSINEYEDNGSNNFATVAVGAENVTVDVTGGSIGASSSEGLATQFVIGAIDGTSAGLSARLDAELRVDGTARYVGMNLENDIALYVQSRYSNALKAEGHGVASGTGDSANLVRITESNYNEIPKTGDSANLIACTFALLASGCGMVLIPSLKRKVR